MVKIDRPPARETPEGEPSTGWPHLQVTERGGIVELILHSEGDSIVWSAAVVRELIEFLIWLKGNTSAKILIFGGCGHRFCGKIDATEFQKMHWRELAHLEQQLLRHWIGLNLIIISAVNGSVHIRSDLAVSADIVLACSEAEFSDRFHFGMNVVPGDGVQLVWQHLLGTSRANYFLLTGERLTADKAKQMGAVHEILPREDLLPRARQLARELETKPASLLAYSKAALRVKVRRHFLEDVSHSLALQGLAMHATGFCGSE